MLSRSPSFQGVASMAPKRHPTRKRRLPRAGVACGSCRKRKVKCNGRSPCGSCVRTSLLAPRTRLPHLGDQVTRAEPYLLEHSFECTFAEKERFVAGDGSPDGIASKRSIPNVNSRTRTPQRGRLRPIIAAAPRSPKSLGKSDRSTVTEPSFDTSSPFTTPFPRVRLGVEGVGELNHHTNGAEYYGRTGTFYFLSRLRSQAKKITDPHRFQASSSTHQSVVNLLHSSDYPVATERIISGNAHQQASGGQTPLQYRNNTYTSHADVQSANLGSGTGEDDVQLQMERECVDLFFQNLHCIHPVLDHESFLTRCDLEIWSIDKRSSPGHLPDLPPPIQARNRFLALFNAVLALGAVVAGQNSMLNGSKVVRFLDSVEQQQHTPLTKNTTTHPPIRAAAWFFGKSKSYLEDVFESSSLETVQTLFLMSVFCQSALKPHSCYMYGGMAVRTALAIGVPTAASDMNSLEGRLWWAIYSHEVEMCSSAGRQTFCHARDYHLIPPSPYETSSGPSINLISCMSDLAHIVTSIAENAGSANDTKNLPECSAASLCLDKSLDEWKSQLPPEFNLDEASLDENELLTKQKTVLRLRLLNAKIMCHRPFLAFGVAEPCNHKLNIHFRRCIEAARETIQFMHSMYLHRPYFRTWWYNCTYVLDATMVIIYAILSKLSPCSVEAALNDVDKSVEIFKAMKVHSVARSCAEITLDLQDVARKAEQEPAGQGLQMQAFDHTESSTRRDGHEEVAARADEPVDASEMATIGGADCSLQFEGDPYASLLDPNLLHNFLSLDSWSPYISPSDT